MFHKVMFSRSGYGTTAGLIVESSRVNLQDVVEVSRLFPASAAPYMRRLHVSPAFPSFETAFAHVFPVTIEGEPVR